MSNSIADLTEKLVAAIKTEDKEREREILIEMDADPLKTLRVKGFQNRLKQTLKTEEKSRTPPVIPKKFAHVSNYEESMSEEQKTKHQQKIKERVHEYRSMYHDLTNLTKESNKSPLTHQCEHLIREIVDSSQFFKHGIADLRGLDHIKKSEKKKSIQLKELQKVLNNLVDVLNNTDLDIIGALTFISPPSYYNGALITPAFDNYKDWETTEEFLRVAEGFLHVANGLGSDLKLKWEEDYYSRKGKKMSKTLYQDEQFQRIVWLYELQENEAISRHTNQGNQPDGKAFHFLRKCFDIIDSTITDSSLDKRMEKYIKQTQRKRGRPQNAKR